jgi:hypothetical protein
VKYIGFSTGAVALSNFNLALSRLENTTANAIELSALRRFELDPLVAAVNSLDLSQYRYISVHAPSRFDASDELQVIRLLEVFATKEWPIILHPDAIHDYSAWKCFGKLLLIENMDKRKPSGRSCLELDDVFGKLPDARFCFDIAHARQFDSSMDEAIIILNKYKSLITQIHISEVDDNCKHNRISDAAVYDYRRIANLIPQDVSVIIETMINPLDIEDEIDSAKKSLAVI